MRYQILILAILKAGFVNAELIEKYFGSFKVFAIIGVFTLLVFLSLIYACFLDIKHWRKCIDEKQQLHYPEMVAADFQNIVKEESVEVDNLHEAPLHSTIMDSTQTRRTDSTQVEGFSTREMKHLKIIQAMYSSSHREMPEDLQLSVEKRREESGMARNRKVVLNTINEENEGSTRTNGSLKSSNKIE